MLQRPTNEKAVSTLPKLPPPMHRGAPLVTPWRTAVTTNHTPQMRARQPQRQERARKQQNAHAHRRTHRQPTKQDQGPTTKHVMQHKDHIRQRVTAPGPPRTIASHVTVPNRTHKPVPTPVSPRRPTRRTVNKRGTARTPSGQHLPQVQAQNRNHRKEVTTTVRVQRPGRHNQTTQTRPERNQNGPPSRSPYKRRPITRKRLQVQNRPRTSRRLTRPQRTTRRRTNQ